jgi:2-hydroxychromene-2-carboxylate isomerase
MPDTTFYFDLGSPYAYLAAERLEGLLPERPRWQPILLGGIFRLTGRSSWALGDPIRRQAGMAEVERCAQAYGLPPVSWPDRWPSDYLFAMRAATFAFEAGSGREFALRAFRAAFREGVDLSRSESVLALGEEVGFARGEMDRAASDPQVKLALRDATDAAHERGVFGVPTVAVGPELLWGDDRLEDAARRASAPLGSR